jgi:UDPglucose--hexose-1-phosphate uridylyltransferase
MMGCSNPHPHGQIWSSDFLPTEAKKMEINQKNFSKKYGGKVMLLEYLKRELSSPKKERIIIENNHWVVLIPYWAVWPYETMILPKRHIQRLHDIESHEEKQSLAQIIKTLLIKYDNLFKCSFPFSFGFSMAPGKSYLSSDCSHWQLFASYLPPLLRSKSVKKFMVGYELLAQPQRDLTPEKAAEQLRALDGVNHYLSKN